jgi:hypothetical protein
MIPLRRNDPVVSAIHAVLAARHSLRELARAAVHRLRSLR